MRHFSTLGIALAMLALFFVGTTHALFSEPFTLSRFAARDVESGAFACCVFGDTLYCLGGMTGMFCSVNLTVKPLQWQETPLSFRRLHHALVTYGPQIVALGGVDNNNDISSLTSDLFLFNLFKQPFDGLLVAVHSSTPTVFSFLQCTPGRPPCRL